MSFHGVVKRGGRFFFDDGFTLEEHEAEEVMRSATQPAWLERAPTEWRKIQLALLSWRANYRRSGDEV